MFYAVAHGKLKDVKAMVEEDPNVLKLTTDDDQKLSPLHVAAATGQVKVVVVSVPLLLGFLECFTAIKAT